MFEIGWTEMLVIAVVMIVVVGPKDLPNMLRTFGRMTAKLRGMAGDFQKQFNEALKEAELDDVKKSLDTLRDLNPAAEIKKQLNPFEKAAADVRAGLNTLKPVAPKSADPAAPVAQPAEPLKNGATEMPATSGTEAMPSATPVFPPMSDPGVKPSDAPSAQVKAVDVAAAMTGTWKPAAPASTAVDAASVKPGPAAKAPRKRAAVDRLVEAPADGVVKPKKPAKAASAPAPKPAKLAAKPVATTTAESSVATEPKPAAARTTRKKTTGPAA